MFPVITNIYNKKTKWPTLLELFTATGKLKKFSFDNYSCSMCAPLVTRHTSIRYLSSCHTHTSTLVHRYSSLLQWSVTLGQRGHVAMLGRILCTKCTLHSNHRLTVWYSNTQNDFFPRSGHFLTSYTSIAWRQKCELRWKQLTGKKMYKLFLLPVQVS